MPTISMFFGIIIRMFFDEHNPPHFHAYYSEHKAIFDIATGELIEGKFPPKQAKLVTAWSLIHQEELLANWKLAMENETLFKIKPLE